MEYKIVTVFGETYYIENKKELFEFFDLIGGHWNILSKCGHAFNISKEKGSVIVDWEEVFYYEQSIKRPVYSDHMYIIYDKKRFVVNYSKLKDEYKASRNIKDYTPRRWKSGRDGFRSDRRPARHAMYKVAKHSCKKEYLDSIDSIEQGVEVRAKRFSFLRMNHVFFYDDELYRRGGVKSWKEKKVKRQWMKNKKRT